MEKTRRERVALAVLLAMVALTACILGAYFFAGRSWNVAATFLDDTAGQMQDYTIVAYAGVIDAASTKSGDSSASADRVHDESPLAGSAVTNGIDNLASFFTSQAEKAASIFESLAPDSGGDQTFVSTVRSDYELEGARVITLDLENPSRYSEPLVLGPDDRKLGVFFIDHYTGLGAIGDIETSLHEAGARAIICITNDVAYLSTVQGIDAVIVTEPSDETSAFGGYIDDTYFVTAPEKGSTGVLVLTPNNVISSRILTV